MEEIEENPDHDREFTYVATGQIVASILGTAFWLILAVILHPIAYGHFSYLVSIGTLLSTVFVFGLGKTIVTYYPKENNEQLVSTSLFFALMMSIIGGSVTAIVLNYWFEPILAGLVGLLIISMSIFSIAFHSILGRQEYRKYMYTWIGVRSASLAIPLIFYEIWGLVAGLLGGLVAAYFIFGTWILKRFSNGLDFGGLGEKIRFTLEAWGANLGRVSMNFLDKILIGTLFANMAVLGVYQFGYRIFTLLAILPNALFFYLLPEKSAGNKKEKLEKLGILSSIGIAALIFGIAPFITSHIFPGFEEGINLIRIMGVAIIPATLSRIKTSELYSQEKTKPVLGSRLFGLGIGIIGIILTFSKSLGLVGLAGSMLAIQISLLVGLFSFPKMLDIGSFGKIGMSFIGMIVISALLISSLTIVMPQTSVEGDGTEGTIFTMDTVATIKVMDKNNVKSKDAIEKSFDEIERIESLMSTEKKNSQIYRLNHAGTDWIKLSPEVIHVLKKAKEYARKTNGYFDPTAKPLVDLWMEKVKKEGKIPETSELEEKLELVNWKNLIIDEKNNRARFRENGMMITLGGIAKGYAIDQACKLLKANGIENGLVNIGGDIRVFGPKKWEIGIEDPRQEGELLETLYLENKSVVTSGDYRRYYLLGKRRIHHIINPMTGKPATKSISVTIIAKNCISADAYSTSTFVAGPDEGTEILDYLKIAGLIVNSDEEIETSKIWKDNIQN